MPEAPGSEVARDPDRLNGWKEIATFLGKGVRTAQRWERQIGLPVHRLGQAGGEIVFALKSEIAHWSLNQHAALPTGAGAVHGTVEARDGQREASSPGDSGAAGPAPRTGPRRLSFRLLATAVLVVLAGIGAWTVAAGFRNRKADAEAPRRRGGSRDS